MRRQWASKRQDSAPRARERSGPRSAQLAGLALACGGQTALMTFLGVSWGGRVASALSGPLLPPGLALAIVLVLLVAAVAVPYVALFREVARGGASAPNPKTPADAGQSCQEETEDSYRAELEQYYQHIPEGYERTHLIDVQVRLRFRPDEVTHEEARALAATTSIER